MTVKLELTADVQAGLLAQARASGFSLEDYAAQVLREKSRSTSIVPTGSAAKAREFEQWARSHPHNPPLPDEALRRENLVRTPK